MDAQHATAFKQKLEHQRAELLAQIAEQRGGKASRVEVAAEHFAHNEDSDAQVNTARDLEFAINEHETAGLPFEAQPWQLLPPTDQNSSSAPSLPKSLIL